MTRASVAAVTLRWAVGIVLGCTPACTDELPATPERSVNGGTLAFRPCDITTEQGLLANAAECTEVVVPAQREVANGPRVTLSLKRYRTSSQVRGQLWLVAGGPGSAASDYEVDAGFYATLGSDLELYFLDHRGTGRSTRLRCDSEELPASFEGELVRGSEWTSCASRLAASWGQGIGGFNTTEAARDLGEFIELTRLENTPVYLYAVSYGTYLAQRYLQLYPNQPNGVVLDSICSPGQCDLLLSFDRQFDDTARRIFELCATDTACAAELGGDPWSRVRALSGALGTGHCPELGWSATTLRQLLGMMTSIAGLRDYMPAVVKRAARCSKDDRTALARFRDFISGMDTQPSSFSQALGALITLSELAPRPLPTALAVSENVNSLLASVDAGPGLAGAIDGWPVYERDEYFGKFADTSVPMLMLNGTLDPQTPLSVARPAGSFYGGAHQRFVEVPFSPHTTLTQSLMDDSGNTCGAELARQFFENPKGSLALDCLSRVLPLRFSGVPAITRLLFGTESAFADEPPSAAATPTANLASFPRSTPLPSPARF